jgi:4-amino-4-deoxy-L-arabinose transferase-like glycosyltransferase
MARTYRVFSQTADEPIHVVAGYQWLTTPLYDVDAEHPPLARIAFGLDAALIRPKTNRDALLPPDVHYRRNLAGARAGNIPFFLLALAVTGLWARRLFGDNAALLSIALFGALPPILAHASLATTDMAVTATTVLALFLFARWLDEPSWTHAGFVAVACGLGLISKFSFVVFFPAGAAALAGAHLVLARDRQRAGLRRVLQIAAAVPVMFLIVWAAYKFSTGSLNDARRQVFGVGAAPHTAADYASTPGYDWVRADLVERYQRDANYVAQRRGRGVDFVDWAKAAGYPSPAAGRTGDNLDAVLPLPRPPLIDRLLEPMRASWHSVTTHRPIPAPLFFIGLEMVKRHSQSGHAAFLLGDFSDHGWWYYFPVILFFKTPLAFLILATFGIVQILRTGAPNAAGIALAPLAMLVPALVAGIDIGVRHVLPLYPLLTISAAFGVIALWRRSRIAAVILLAWYFIASAAAHPDYISYFNEAAGRHPERIAADSNLDWGQDLLRLAKTVRREHIDHLHLRYFGTADWRSFVPEAEELPPFARVHGWVAISQNNLTFGWPTNDRNAYGWLRAYEPARRVGTSIRLYRVP